MPNVRLFVRGCAMCLPVIAAGCITSVSEIVQIATGIIMLMPKRKKKEIRFERVYNTIEASRLLGVDRRQVIQFIRSRELSARRVGDRYLISGNSLLLFLSSSATENTAT